MGAAVELGLGFLKWAWGHKTLFALIVCAAALAWSRHEISVLRVERDGYEAKVDAATERANSYAAVFDKYKARIAEYEQDIATRNKEIEAERADADRIAKLSRQELAAEQAENADLQTRVAAAEEKAHAHPEDVRPLGPIARDLARSLQSE